MTKKQSPKDEVDALLSQHKRYENLRDANANLRAAILELKRAADLVNLAEDAGDWLFVGASSTRVASRLRELAQDAESARLDVDATEHMEWRELNTKKRKKR